MAGSAVCGALSRFRAHVPWALTWLMMALMLSGGARPRCAPARRRAHVRAPDADAGAAAARPPECAQPPMRIAIYQGKWWHSEVFGTFIDVAATCGHELVIYYDPSHATSATGLYGRLYAGRFRVEEPARFLSDEPTYDAVIFTTPDDSPDDYLQKRNAHRFIYTIHLLEPAYAKPHMVLRLHMSTIVAWPFVVPVYDGGGAAAIDGKSRTVAEPGSWDALPPPRAETRVKEIMMIGTLWDGDNYDIKEVYKLAELIEPHGWKLVAYTRHWGTEHAPPRNMRLELSKGTEEVRAGRAGGNAPALFAEPAHPITHNPATPSPAGV
jgi:hypothetical protein